MYERNCFVTLTYNDDNLPVMEEQVSEEEFIKKPSLNKRDFVLFMKKVRKKYGRGIRFFHCGEYGSATNRPHHHACLFNHDFGDKTLWTVRSGVKLYRSEELEKIWQYGNSTIGEVTFESAAYVARYVLKKIMGQGAQEHYGGIQEEYVTMSRRPGIGRTWYDAFKNDVFLGDKIVVREDKICKPPKYYEKIYDQESRFDLGCIKYRRRKNTNKENNTYDRLLVREKVVGLKIERNLKRSYENDAESVFGS